MPDAPPNGEPLHLLYIADPMCSWCYGFAPVITAIAGHFGERLPVRLVMGGLRAGNTRPMEARDKAYIKSAWQRIAAATGLRFDHAFFDREGFVYDTEPACRAVVAMRRAAPGKALSFLSAVSRAFYAEGRDTTSLDVLADLAREAEEDRERFEAALLAPETRNETFRDFLAAQEMGVEGFPTLAAGPTAQGYALVTNGYRPLDGLIEAVETWLGRVRRTFPGEHAG
jgi:putative protein-disulfide isomerase